MTQDSRPNICSTRIRSISKCLKVFSHFVLADDEDEQTDSKSGETECRTQTERTGALLPAAFCLPDQRLVLDTQINPQSPLGDQLLTPAT